MATEQEVNNDKYVHQITKTVVEITGEGHNKKAVVVDPGETRLTEGQQISKQEVLRSKDWSKQ